MALKDLPRRAALTYRYHGARSLLARLLTFPLRFTPLRYRLPYGHGLTEEQLTFQRWYQRHGRRVTIVIPSYRDADLVRSLVASIRATTARRRVRIIVADDASGPKHLEALRKIPGVEVVEGEENAGFSANANRGFRAASPHEDVVILNSDVVALPAWLASLQYAAAHEPRVGIVGAKLLYPDDRIQFAGTVRNLGAREWFDHRFRFRPRGWPPANVALPAIAVTGACMYVTRRALDQLQGFDETMPMAYEDIDFCLRAWSAGFRVLYWPASELYHRESVTRGTELGARERESQRVFWEKWGEFLDRRNVRTPSGSLRIIVVAQDGKDVDSKSLGELLERGDEVELWAVGSASQRPDAVVPVRIFADAGSLEQALAPVDAIKVATSAAASATVWEASVLRGIPVRMFSRPESASNPDDRAAAWQRHEFRYLAESETTRQRLGEIGLDATVVAPADSDALERFLVDVAAPESVDLAGDSAADEPIQQTEG